MVNHGLLVCSFLARKRFAKKDSNPYKLNQTHEAKIEDKSVVFEDFWGLLRQFCDERTEMIDNSKLQKIFTIKQNSLKEYEEETFRAVSFIVT